MRPVAGLPLLHVEEPELSGVRQVLKASVEWVFATVAFLLAVAGVGRCWRLLVRLDSARARRCSGRPGSASTGREFTVYKLRTMRADAESLLESLREQNEAADGLLFKIREDPRVTRVGKYLRKWSLDELPQLWNVVRGDMALVGPRPPLPGEVAQYGAEVARRLLVRPGITGLWQVSGPVEPELGRQCPPGPVLRRELVAGARRHDRLEDLLRVFRSATARTDGLRHCFDDRHHRQRGEQAASTRW